MKCKFCGRVKSVLSLDDRTWFCSHCQKMFDAEPDEGDYGTDPSRRMSRQEEQRGRGDGPKSR